MDWININIPRLMSSAEYIGSDHKARGIWLSVLRYCYQAENIGRVVGGADWEDSSWMECCGVTSRDVRFASKLLTVKDHDILVLGYEAAKQRECEVKRQAGREAALKRWGNRIGQDIGHLSAEKVPQLPISDKLPQCGNGSGSGSGSGSSPTPAIDDHLHPEFATLRAAAREGCLNDLPWETWRILLNNHGLACAGGIMTEAQVVQHLFPLVSTCPASEVRRKGSGAYISWKLTDLVRGLRDLKKNGGAPAAEQAPARQVDGNSI